MPGRKEKAGLLQTQIDLLGDVRRRLLRARQSARSMVEITFVSTVVLPNLASGTTLPTRGRSPAGEVAVLLTVREVFVRTPKRCADQSSVKKSSPNEPRYENHSVCCMALSRPIADRKNFISCFLHRTARP